MMTSVRDGLIEKLIEVGNLYPAMRFGQLLCFAASIATDREFSLMQELDDESVLKALTAHVTKRGAEEKVEAYVGNGTVSSARSELVPLLQELAERYSEWGVGQLVFRLAALAHINVYDIEDEELLAVARATHPGVQWFQRYTEQLEQKSTVQARCSHAAYRCPCCQSRTLYERGGFDICPVCCWEDDGQDDADADTVRGGPNGALSLTAARTNYLQSGVCDQKYAEHVRPPRLQER